MAHITIKRARQSVDILRKYKIICDGNIIGFLKRGEGKEFHIESGDHTIVLKLDWVRSNVLTFHIEEDQHLHFECKSNLSLWKMPLGLLYCTVWARSCLHIQVAGKSNIANQSS